MTIRIEYPFYAQFEMADPGSNSRELRTQFLQTYLMNSGMELGHAVEDFQVSGFSGDESGEIWQVKSGN